MSSNFGFRTRQMHKIKNANGRCSDQPLAGKTFYMDIKVPSVLTKLCQRILNLGGQIENFLSKDVSFLITDKTVNADGMKKAYVMTKVGPNLSNSLGPISRGKALLLKATSMQSQEIGTSSNRLLQIAINLGVKVETIDSFLYSTSKLMARVKRQKNSLAKKILRKDTLSDVTAVKWDTGKENTFILKVEDDQCLYKPLFKQFDSFPTIAYNESGSPFDVGVVLTKLDENKLSKKKLVGGALRGGYCESCHYWYKCTLREHLNSVKHNQFAESTEIFVSLNEIISKILDSKNLEDRFKLPNTLDNSSGVVSSINNLAIPQSVSQAISPHLQLTSAQFDSTTMSALNDTCSVPPLRNSKYVSYRSCIGISDTKRNLCVEKNSAIQTESNVESCCKMIVDNYQDVVVNSIPEPVFSQYLSCLSQEDQDYSNDSIKSTDIMARQRTSCEKQVDEYMKDTCFTAVEPGTVINVSSCEIGGDDVISLDQQVKLFNFGLKCVNKVFDSGGHEDVLLDSKDAQATDIVMDTSPNNGQSCKVAGYLERPFEVFSHKSVVDLDVGNQINYWCQHDAYIPDCKDTSISDLCQDPDSLCKPDGSHVQYCLSQTDASHIPDNSLSHPDASHVPDKLCQPNSSYVPDSLSQPDASHVSPSQPDAFHVPDKLCQPNSSHVPDSLSQPDASHVNPSQPDAFHVPDKLCQPNSSHVPDSLSQPDASHVSPSQPDASHVSPSQPDAFHVPDKLCQPNSSHVPDSLSQPDVSHVSPSQPDASHVSPSQPDASHVPNNLSKLDACQALDCVSQPDTSHAPDDLSKPGACQSPDCVSQPDACPTLDCVSKPNACHVPDDLSKPDACRVLDSKNKPGVCHVSVCVVKPGAFVPEFSSSYSFGEIGVRNVLSLLNSNISNHASIKGQSSSVNSGICKSVECAQNPFSDRQSTVSENSVNFEGQSSSVNSGIHKSVECAQNPFSDRQSNVSEYSVNFEGQSSSVNSGIHKSVECAQNPFSDRQPKVSENSVNFEVAGDIPQTILATDNSIWKDETELKIEELPKGEICVENYLSSYEPPDVNTPYVNTHYVESFDYKNNNAVKMPVITWLECSSKLISDNKMFPNKGISNLSQSFDKRNVEPVDGSEAMRNFSGTKMPNGECFQFNQKQTHNAEKFMSGVLVCVANPNYSNITEEMESENTTTRNNPGIHCDIENMKNVTPVKKNSFQICLRNVMNSGFTVRNWLLPNYNKSLKYVGENLNVMLADNQQLQDLSFFKDSPNENQCSEDNRKVADWILTQPFDKYQTVDLQCPMQGFENILPQTLTLKDSNCDTDVHTALEEVSGDMINKMNTVIEKVSDIVIDEEMDTALEEESDDLINEIHTTIENVPNNMSNEIDTALEEVPDNMINEKMHTALEEEPDDLTNEIHTTFENVPNNMINEMDTALHEMPDNLIKNAEFCVQSDENNNTCADMSDGTWSDNGTSISDDTIENFHIQTVETEGNGKSETQNVFLNLDMEANDLSLQFCQHDESNKAVDEIRLPSSKETENFICLSSLKSSVQPQNLQPCYDSYATYIKEQLEAGDFLINAMRNNEESDNLNTNVEMHKMSPEQHHVKEVETKMESLYQPMESFHIVDIGHNSTNEMEEKQHAQTSQQVKLPDLKLIEVASVMINKTLSPNNQNICGHYEDKLQMNETNIPLSNLCPQNLLHFDYDETFDNPLTYLYSQCNVDATQAFYRAFINGQYCNVNNADSDLFYAGFQCTLDQSTNYIVQNTSAGQQYVDSVVNRVNLPLSQKREHNSITNETFVSYPPVQNYVTAQQSHCHSSENEVVGSQESTDSQRTVAGGLVLTNGFLVNVNFQQSADDGCQTVHFLSSSSNFLAQNLQTASSHGPNSQNLPAKSLSPNFLSYNNCRPNDDLSTIQQDDIAEDTSATYNYCFQDRDTDTFNQPSDNVVRHSGNDSISEVCDWNLTHVLNSSSAQQVQGSEIVLSSANNDGCGHLENGQCIQTDYRSSAKSVIPSSHLNSSYSHISVPASVHHPSEVFINKVVHQGNVQVQNNVHVSSSHCVTKSQLFVNHQRQALLKDTSQAVQPVPVYNAVQLGDTKLKLQKMPASKVGQKSDLMQYWNVRKSGDCRLVFSSNMTRKRKAKETPGKIDDMSSFCDDSNRLSVNRDNEEQHANKRRCLML